MRTRSVTKRAQHAMRTPPTRRAPYVKRIAFPHSGATRQMHSPIRARDRTTTAFSHSRAAVRVCVQRPHSGVGDEQGRVRDARGVLHNHVHGCRPILDGDHVVPALTAVCTGGHTGCHVRMRAATWHIQETHMSNATRRQIQARAIASTPHNTGNSYAYASHAMGECGSTNGAQDALIVRVPCTSMSAVPGPSRITGASGTLVSYLHKRSRHE